MPKNEEILVTNCEIIEGKIIARRKYMNIVTVTEIESFLLMLETNIAILPQ
ncbi:MAG: hypothetical protein ACP5NL_07345 [Thermoplasmata archaeon]